MEEAALADVAAGERAGLGGDVVEACVEQSPDVPLKARLAFSDKGRLGSGFCAGEDAEAVAEEGGEILELQIFGCEQDGDTSVVADAGVVEDSEAVVTGENETSTGASLSSECGDGRPRR